MVALDKSKLPIYGGQAVIEGVMMRGRKSMAIAMRAPDHTIVVHKEYLSPIYQGAIVRIPFLRGLVMLWDALGLGVRALTISANLQTSETNRFEGLKLGATLLVSLSFAIGLFFILPASIGHLTEGLLSRMDLPFADQILLQMDEPTTLSAYSFLGANTRTNYWLAWIGNLVEGLVRLVILIGYIWTIGRLPDIQRVFAYHGAEHKTINAFEAGEELTPEIVQRYPLEHPRCGTAFLLTLILLSIILFAFLGPLPIALRLISRVAFIPMLAALAYEYIRWSANHINTWLVRVAIKPNLALQRLTTRQPDLEMLEVAICAFNAMHAGEEELIT